MNIKMRWALAAALSASLATTSAPAAERDSTAAQAAAERDGELSKRFLDETLHSSNLRLRVMAGRLFDSTAGELSAQTLIPIDELAESARGSTDPMVLALLIDACSNVHLKPKPTCDAVELAKRWTIADTQNQLAWLTLASVLRSRGDGSGSRAAFERASTASMWHEYYDDGLRVAAAAVPRDLDPRARLTALQGTAAIAAMALVPNAAVFNLWFHCKDPTLRDACARITDTIARDSGSLLSTHIAIMTEKRMGMDAGTLATRERGYDALQGAWIGHVPRDVADISDPKELAEALARTERRIELGELPSLRAMLSTSGLTEAASAERYRQYRTARVQEARSAAAAD